MGEREKENAKIKDNKKHTGQVERGEIHPLFSAEEK
jgi:hypothetical protein